MDIPRLEHENVTGYYDDTTHLLRVTYKGVVNAEVSARVYAWIGELVATMGLGESKGSVYDFRQVKDFAPGNVTTTQSRSSNLNTKIDMSKHPVALIASNIYQQKMVESVMHITPQEKRKRVVKSEDEALNFIQEFIKSLEVEGKQ